MRDSCAACPRRSSTRTLCAIVHKILQEGAAKWFNKNAYEIRLLLQLTALQGERTQRVVEGEYVEPPLAGQDQMSPMSIEERREKRRLLRTTGPLIADHKRETNKRRAAGFASKIALHHHHPLLVVNNS